MFEHAGGTTHLFRHGHDCATGPHHSGTGGRRLPSRSRRGATRGRNPPGSRRDIRRIFRPAREVRARVDRRAHEHSRQLSPPARASHRSFVCGAPAETGGSGSVAGDSRCSGSASLPVPRCGDSSGGGRVQLRPCGTRCNRDQRDRSPPSSDLRRRQRGASH